MAVAAQRRSQPVRRRVRLVRQQPGQVAGHLTALGFGHHLGRRVADALQRPQRARLRPARELARGQGLEHARPPAERLHAVGRRPGPFQLERDLPQRLEWIHVASPTRPGRIEHVQVVRNFLITGRSGLRRATTSKPCRAKTAAIPENRLPVCDGTAVSTG